MGIHVIWAILCVIFHHENRRILPIWRVADRLYQTAYRVVVACHLREWIFEAPGVRREVAEMVFHEIDHLEVRQITIPHIFVKLPIPFFKPILIRSVEVPAAVVHIGVVQKRLPHRYCLHHLLREGVADDWYIEWSSRS